MSATQTFIRKPVVETVKARRVPSMPVDTPGVMEEIRDIATWCNGRIDYGSFAPRIIFPMTRFDGRDVAFMGDWVVQTEGGEFTQMSNAAFEATYGPDSETGDVKGPGQTVIWAVTRTDVRSDNGPDERYDWQEPDDADLAYSTEELARQAASDLQAHQDRHLVARYPYEQERLAKQAEDYRRARAAGLEHLATKPGPELTLEQFVAAHRDIVYGVAPINIETGEAS